MPALRQRRQLLLRRAAAFTPTQIAGLQAWYKADALALNDGDLVASWADSGGALGLAATASGALRPTYKANIQNGKPVVRFDGTNTFLQTAAFGANLAQPTTWFVVCKNTAVDTTQRHVIDAAGISPPRQVIGRRNSTGNKWFVYAGSFLTGPAEDANWNIFTAIYNGASSSIQVNGNAATSGAAGANALNGITIGCNNTSAFSNYWQGDVAEILLYNSALGSADQASVRSYLNSKWAVF